VAPRREEAGGDRLSRDALRRALAAQELERRRIARELHDEIAQALTSLLLGLRALDSAAVADQHEAIANLRELAVSTLRDVRRLAADLRPKALDDFGLEPALSQLAATWSAATGIPTDVSIHLGAEPVAGEPAIALYRVAQEALSNVVKHARARRVQIVVHRQDGAVQMLIEDDGVGMPGDEQGERAGLARMRERVELLDGRLRVDPQAGSGTRLLIEVPSP
jgi:signal transduction histidine kinase